MAYTGHSGHSETPKYLYRVFSLMKIYNTAPPIKHIIDQFPKSTADDIEWAIMKLESEGYIRLATIHDPEYSEHHMNIGTPRYIILKEFLVNE